MGGQAGDGRKDNVLRGRTQPRTQVNARCHFGPEIRAMYAQRDHRQHRARRRVGG